MNAGPPGSAEPASPRWHDDHDLDALKGPWDALLDRDPDASIFQTHEWVSAWSRTLGSAAHGNKGRLRILAIWRAQRLVALAPMAESSSARTGASVLALAGDPQSDRSGVLRDPSDLEALALAVRSIADQARCFDLIRLAEIDKASPTNAALVHLASQRAISAISRDCSSAPYLPLDRPWSDIESGLPSSLRTRLKRARSKQRQAGGVIFRRWQPEPSELPTLLDEFANLERQSWKGGEGVGIFSTTPSREFFTLFADSAARRSWLDTATLRLPDGRLIAYRFGFRFRAAFLDYNLAHDPEFDRLSPGRVLLDDIIRDSHRLGLASVDASRGKLHPPHLLRDWTPATRTHARWLIFGRSLRGRCLEAVERVIKPTARKLVAARRTPRPNPSPPSQDPA